MKVFYSLNLKLLLLLLGLFGKHFELLVEEVPNYLLRCSSSVAIKLGNILRSMLPKLLSAFRPRGASCLTTGCRILDSILLKLVSGEFEAGKEEPSELEVVYLSHCQVAYHC